MVVTGGYFQWVVALNVQYEGYFPMVVTAGYFQEVVAIRWNSAQFSMSLPRGCNKKNHYFHMVVMVGRLQSR